MFAKTTNLRRRNAATFASSAKVDGRERQVRAEHVDRAMGRLNLISATPPKGCFEPLVTFEVGGLLVSELPPGTKEDQNTVITSCRLQAGLSRVLLLVQSSPDGGSKFAVEHFCKLPRKLAFIVPPETEAQDAAFGANGMMASREGLAEFARLKTTKSINANLLPLNSRGDFAAVLNEFESSKAQLL
jgi:hypothetical protein